MRLLNRGALGVVATGLAFLACGSGGGQPDGGIVVPADAGDAECNPVAQTGCAPGEKCASILESEDPMLARTGCVPDGTVPIGGACMEGDPGPTTGYDDCARGGQCLRGMCAPICSLAPDSCDGDSVCVPFSRMFVDLDGVGLCQPRCDVLAQDCADQDLACYIRLNTGVGSCAPPTTDPDVPGATGPGGQGDACNYINTCEKGYGCTLLNSPHGATGLVCAFFCDALDTGTGPTCSDGPGPGYECIAINQFYSDAPLVPDEVGFCVDPAEWGL